MAKKKWLSQFSKNYKLRKGEGRDEGKNIIFFVLFCCRFQNKPLFLQRI